MSPSITRKNLLPPALFLAALAGFAASQGFWGPGSRVTAQSTSLVAPATRPAASGEFRGFSLQLNNSNLENPYEKLLDEIVATGANTVNLVVPGHQENCSSNSIFIDVRKCPGPKRVVEIVRYAKKIGLSVVLMPIVLLENGREGEWRGKINPEKWEEWWKEYDSYILYNANLAQEGGADVFMVGSELVSTEKQSDKWKALIAEVRKVFKGRLSYSANWDHYKPIDWWGDLDIIGMTTYYDLTGGKKPTVETLVDAWKPIRKEILEWQAKINRPLIFTEVGWPNQVTCGQYPWDYYRSPDSPDPEAQANCFEAFFRTWASDTSTAGYLVWEWRTSVDQKIDEKDTSYSPEGKRAMAVIKKYLNQPKGAPDKAAPGLAVPAQASPAPAAAAEEGGETGGEKEGAALAPAPAPKDEEPQ
jgi:hypothetical protein